MSTCTYRARVRYLVRTHVAIAQALHAPAVHFVGAYRGALKGALTLPVRYIV